MKSNDLTVRFPRLSLAGIPLALLAVAALLALAALLPDTRAAQAQSEGATQAPGLQVSIAANPVNPPVNEPTTLTATITNSPSEQTPAYNWEIEFGGDWYSFGGGSVFRYGNGKAETLRFRLTVSYDTGESATSEPVAVTWVAPEPTSEPTPTPTPAPTQDSTPEPTPTASPTPTPTLEPTQEPTPEPTQEPTQEPTPTPTASPTPTPTPEPTPEPTEEPTPEPTPTPTASPTPTPTPEPTPIIESDPTPEHSNLLVPQATPAVTGVRVSSSPASGDTYLLGETIHVTITFSQEVDVTGTPQMKIDMDPAEWGEKTASYDSGTGTASLTFAHTVVQPNYSTQGIAVLANSLALNGGTIKSSATQADAELSHIRLEHNADHKVDWQRSPQTSTPTPTPQTPTPTPIPSVTGVEVTSSPLSGDTYLLGETIRVTITFSEDVDVTGAPQLKIDMDPADWGEKLAGYDSGTGTASLTFAHTVVEPNFSSQGIAVLADSLALNGGSIRSLATQADAALSHIRLEHNAAHKVDWQRSPPAQTPTPTPDPAATPTPESTPTPEAGVPRVISAAITSDPGGDNTYGSNEVIEVTVTFSEPVNVTGARVNWQRGHGGPKLLVHSGVAGGGRWAIYKSGSGTDSLTFAYSVWWPLYSTRGIAVEWNSLTLDGGAIKSAATGADAVLSLPRVEHDPNHKVDWQWGSQFAPKIIGLVIVSRPRNNNTYATGEMIRIRLKSSERRMNITGSPRLKLDLNSAEGGEVWAHYEGSDLSHHYFSYMVVHPNVSTEGIAVVADSLELNGGTIRSRATQTDADLAHGGLYHDSTLKVNGVRTLPPKQFEGNDPPICTGSADSVKDKKYAPPLHKSYYIGLYCADADGDELTFTVTSDPPNVSMHMSFDNAISRVWFQALGHCELEAITPALPGGSFTTTVTVTATDPHGASATGKAYFDTYFKSNVNLLTNGCPNVTSAEGATNKITLTFDVHLDSDSVPATGDFVVKVDGETVALADSGVSVNYNTVILTLAAAVTGQPTVTVSYTPGDNPIRGKPSWEGVKAEAFEDHPVNFPPPQS